MHLGWERNNLKTHLVFAVPGRNPLSNPGDSKDSWGKPKHALAWTIFTLLTDTSFSHLSQYRVNAFCSPERKRYSGYAWLLPSRNSQQRCKASGCTPHQLDADVCRQGTEWGGHWWCANWNWGHPYLLGKRRVGAWSRGILSWLTWSHFEWDFNIFVSEDIARLQEEAQQKPGLQYYVTHKHTWINLRLGTSVFLYFFHVLPYFPPYFSSVMEMVILPSQGSFSSSLDPFQNKQKKL